MSKPSDLSELIGNPFHAAALAAFVEQARRQQSWPCPAATRALAYRYYEETIAESARSVAPPHREPTIPRDQRHCIAVV